MEENYSKNLKSFVEKINACPFCKKGKLIDEEPKIRAGRTLSLLEERYWKCGSYRKMNILHNNCTDGLPIEEKIPLDKFDEEILKKDEENYRHFQYREDCQQKRESYIRYKELLDRHSINEKIRGSENIEESKSILSPPDLTNVPIWCHPIGYILKSDYLSKEKDPQTGLKIEKEKIVEKKSRNKKRG